MKAHFKKFKDIGPGGMRCSCCAPNPGKDKRAFLRATKRKEKRTALREAMKEF